MLNIGFFTGKGILEVFLFSHSLWPRGWPESVGLPSFTFTLEAACVPIRLWGFVCFKMFVSLHMGVFMCPAACGGQKQALCFLELESRVVLSHDVGVLFLL